MKFVCKCCGCCCQGFDCLPAYEWEIENIKDAAKKRGLKLKIGPDPKNTFIDEISGTAVCILYGIYNDPCAFLLDGICTNYHGRLLICRQFPISTTPYFNLISPDSFGANSFFDCNCFDCKKKFEDFFSSRMKGVVSKKEIEDYLIENYGEQYFYAKHVGMINDKIKNLIETFSRDGKVRFAKKENFNGVEVLPFFEFLRRRNLISDVEKERYFERFNLRIDSFC